MFSPTQSSSHRLATPRASSPMKHPGGCSRHRNHPHPALHAAVHSGHRQSTAPTTDRTALPMSSCRSADPGILNTHTHTHTHTIGSKSARTHKSPNSLTTSDLPHVPWDLLSPRSPARPRPSRHTTELFVQTTPARQRRSGRRGSFPISDTNRHCEKLEPHPE